MRPILPLLLAAALLGPGHRALADCPPGPIHVGAAPLRLGMSRAEVTRALAAGGDPLVTRLDDARAVATDVKARRPLAVLTFDRAGHLVRIQRNRGPEAAGGLDLAEALHRVLSEPACGSAAPCTAVASHRLLTGPNAAVRDPGKPDLDVREVEFACGARTVQLHVNSPTAASQYFHGFIERVVLYESFGDAAPAGSERPAGRP